MKFVMVVRVNGKNFRMSVERVYQSDQVEHYKVTGGNRFILLRTNQPLLRKKGLKYRKGQWKVIGGDHVWNLKALEEITETIQQYIDQFPNKSSPEK